MQIVKPSKTRVAQGAESLAQQYPVPWAACLLVVFSTYRREKAMDIFIDSMEWTNNHQALVCFALLMVCVLASAI